MESDERERLIEKVQPLFVEADDFYISSGLDFWFTPACAKAKMPVRWKQYLITWSAIYPLALGVPFIVAPIRRLSGVPSSLPHYTCSYCRCGLSDSLCGHAALHAFGTEMAFHLTVRPNPSLQRGASPASRLRTPDLGLPVDATRWSYDHHGLGDRRLRSKTR